MINPKNWNKKQRNIAIAAATILVLGGVGIGVGAAVHDNNVQHEQEVSKQKAEAKKEAAAKAAQAKAERLSKDKETAAEKNVATLLATATKNPTDSDIKAVTDAISKLSNQSEKVKDTNAVKALSARLALIKKAQAAVKDYQAHATDADKQKEAQAAINSLTDKNGADVKVALQKLYDASNEQAQAAQKAATALNSSSSGSNASQSTASNGSSVSGRTSSAGVASANTGSSNSASSGTSSSSQVSSGTTQPSTPTPTYEYEQWVSIDGVIKYSKVFSTVAAGDTWTDQMMNSQAIVSLALAGHSIRNGMTTIQVN